MSFDAKMLEGLLVCTKCRSSLVRDGDQLVCVRPECRRQYGVRDEIPNMLVEDSQVLETTSWGQAMQRHGRDAASGARTASN